MATYVKYDKYLKELLKAILGKEITRYQILNTKYMKDRKKQKGQTLDLLVQLEDNEIINIKLNLHFYPSTLYRNLLYEFKTVLNTVQEGEKYKTDMKMIQVNLNFDKKGKHFFEEIGIFNRTTQELYVPNILIYNYNIENYLELYYNGNRKLTKEKLIFV